MSNSEIKYYQEDYTETRAEERENLSEDVLNILQLFRLLSASEKVDVKRLIREEEIF
jgi:hypothetical protein